MLAEKPIMGWNSWNTFAENISEQLIIETADAMVEKGYLEAGYNYLIIDDCWSLRERQNGKLVPDPKLFPNGMKYVADYVHSKGLKFGMYSCAGVRTCAGYPSSYGYEFEDAKQFAEWGVDYLKYDFCHFPKSADCKNAYLTMSMALRNSGRDIVFAACNWGREDPAKWMRSRGAHTYRSTMDIIDNVKSFTEIYSDQCENVEGNAPGCHNDMDMLIVGMHGKGHVGIGGCSSSEYLLHFALWSYFGSPLIIGGDIRSMPEEDRQILLNPGLISINQDAECRAPFYVGSRGKIKVYMKLMDAGKFAIAIINIDEENKWLQESAVVAFDDIGIRSNTGRSVKFTDAVTGEDMGYHKDFVRVNVDTLSCRILVGEVCDE